MRDGQSRRQHYLSLCELLHRVIAGMASILYSRVFTCMMYDIHLRLRVMNLQIKEVLEYVVSLNLQV